MNFNILTTNMDRLPAIDEIINISTGITSHLTKSVLNVTNSTLKLIHKNVTTTPAPLPPMTTSVAALAATTVQQWLQQQQDAYPNTTFAFLTNLTYNRANVHMPVNAAPDIEDDEIRLEHAPQLSKTILVKVYFLSIMALLSLLGNLLTMWNIYKTRIARRNSRHSWSAIYSLIFHLSIADVLVTGFCIFGEAAWSYTVQWLANELTCKLMKLIQMFSLYLSTYVLVLIGVDRWIAVKYPMKSLNMAKRCYRLLGGTYILSFLLSLPQFFIFRVARGPFIEEFYQCVTHGFYTAQWQEQVYTTLTLVLTFLLPLCILLGTYMSTFRTISSSEKMFQGSKLAAYTNKPSGQTNRQRLIHKAKMKSLRISVVIIIAFLICWTPYNVMMLIFMFCDPDKRLSDDLQSAIFFFGMSNSLVNPLIYGAFHLCPMKRKVSKKSYNNNGTYSLNRYNFRGDSQRTPSMLTAVTQIDCNGRQVRMYRQSSYYRSISTGSTYKENIGLLPTTANDSNTPGLIRKSSSMKSPHPNQRNLVHHNVPHHQLPMITKNSEQAYHNHSTEIIQNDNSTGSNCSHSDGSGRGSGAVCSEGRGVSVVLNYDNQRGGVATAKRCSTGSANGIEIHKINGNLANNMTGTTLGLPSLMSGIEDNVSSV